MSSRILYFLIATLVLIGGAFYLYDAHQKQAQAPTVSELSQQSMSTNQTETATAPTDSIAPSSNKDLPKVDPPVTSDPGIDGSDVAVHSIVYDGTKFIPTSITIKQGDIIIFKNASSKGFWPATDPHPSHTNYPGFDADHAVAPGDTFEFKFTKLGNWGYHDHLNPSTDGSIVVTK